MKVFVATLTTDPKEHYKRGADGPMRKDTIVNDLWLAGLTYLDDPVSVLLGVDVAAPSFGLGELLCCCK